MIPAPAPGLYRDVPAETYHSWLDAVNASLLRELAVYPPAQVHWERLHPKDETPAKAFGTLLHTLVLERDALEARYAVAPELDKRTVVGKQAWAAFQAETLAAGRTPMEPARFARAQAIRDAAWRDPFVRRLLEDPAGMNEVSVVWQDETHGLRCRLRADRIVRIGGTTLVLDLKSAASAERTAFGRAIANFGYHIAAAWYLRGLSALAPLERTFLWVVIDKDPPHLPAVYQVDPEDLAEGHAECDRLLALYAHCLSTDSWPGYTPDGQAVICSRPHWARRKRDIDDGPPAEDDTSMEINF